VKLSPAFGIGQRVWHKATGEHCGIVVWPIIVQGPTKLLYTVSWSDLEERTHTESELTDVKPVEL
jgi:hypothetical protein